MKKLTGVVEAIVFRAPAVVPINPVGPGVVGLLVRRVQVRVPMLLPRLPVVRRHHLPLRFLLLLIEDFDLSIDLLVLYRLIRNLPASGIIRFQLVQLKTYSDGVLFFFCLAQMESSSDAHIYFHNVRGTKDNLRT